MVKGLRACPVCPSCSSKKFKIVAKDEEKVIVECLSCAKQITV